MGSCRQPLIVECVLGIFMHRDSVQTELTCRICGAKQRCGPTQMMQRLSDIGMMKRSSDPDLDLLHELFRNAADRLSCHVCEAVGLNVAEASDEDEWEDIRQCEACRKPISPERLAVFPDVTRCATCQTSSENGSDQEREFCDHCGSVMTIRLRRSTGSAAYEMKCPNCGR